MPCNTVMKRTSKTQNLWYSQFALPIGCAYVFHLRDNRWLARGAWPMLGLKRKNKKRTGFSNNISRRVSHTLRRDMNTFRSQSTGSHLHKVHRHWAPHSAVRESARGGGSSLPGHGHRRGLSPPCFPKCEPYECRRSASEHIGGGTTTL